MTLLIERHCSAQFAILMQCQMARSPTSFRRRGTALLSGAQKCMLQEWVIVAEQCIPVVAGNVVDRVVYGYFCQDTNASRYFSASSAAMQPAPAEVTAWR
jgi:hypothetical protein